MDRESPGDDAQPVTSDAPAAPDVSNTGANDTSVIKGTADGSGDASAQQLSPTPPPDRAPWPRRPQKHAALDLSAEDDDEDGMLFGALPAPSAQGAPRNAIPALRLTPAAPRNSQPGATSQQANEELSEPQSRASSPRKICDDMALAFSERAVLETRLLEALPFRELTLSENGKVEIDGPYEMQEKNHSILDELWHIELVQSELQEAPHLEQGAAHMEVRTMLFEAWCEWSQRSKDLHAVREELREQALLGHISANLMGLVAAAGGVVTATSNVSLGVGVGVGTSQEPLGSEPPPTPVVQRRRRQRELDAGASGLPVDQRYQHACTFVGLHAKPMVVHALRQLEGGQQSLPHNFSMQAYLGNRGAQALLLALAADMEEEKELHDLNELRTLNLAGHGIGNEAADALCKLMPRCPRLQAVDLSRNHISEAGAHRLLEEVMAHPCIASVKLDQNPVPSWLRLRLKQVVSTRKNDLTEDGEDSPKGHIRSPSPAQEEWHPESKW